MKIRVAIPSVEEIEVVIRGDAKVEDLKKLACKKLGIEPEHTGLLVEGQRLDPRMRIGELSARAIVKITVDYLWARHLILWGKKGQRRLRQANVLIVGAGAIGNEVAKNLAMLGIGRIGVVDNDLVELSNTSRMVFFERKAVGRPKAEVLAQTITRRFPSTKAVAYNCNLESIQLTAYLNADVIVCGLDNVVSRIFLATIGLRYGIPIVDGGIQGYRARVQTYLPTKSACLACVYPREQYAQLAKLRNRCDPPADEVKIPSLSTTNSLVSSVQTQEILKLIVGYSTFVQTGNWTKEPLEPGEPMPGVWFADLRYGRYAVVSLTKNPRCMVCGENGLGSEPARKIEIPIEHLGRSAKSANKAILDLLPSRCEDMQVWRLGAKVRPTGSKVRNAGLAKVRAGDFLQVIFKSRPDRYEELIAKVI